MTLPRYAFRMCIAGAVASCLLSSAVHADNGVKDQPEQADAQKGVTSIVARTADIFSRVPCRAPKGGVKVLGPLSHVAGKLAAGKPVVIVALGSSSTEGVGATERQYTYPDRLAAQLRRRYPGADISVINAGKGGEDTPEMLSRLERDVIARKPDLVIWQVGTNAVLRNLDETRVAHEIEDGLHRIKAIGADVVLIDPQYAPAMTQKREAAGKMVNLLGKIAEIRKVGLFPRFEVMREWHEGQSLPFDAFVVPDGLHMNNWGYACFAQLLGDTIIKSVGEIRHGQTGHNDTAKVSK